MKLLIVHQNFPGQFRHIAEHAHKSPDFQVLGIGRDTALGLPGVQMLRYKPTRIAGEATHPYLKNYENAVLHGQQVLRLARTLKNQGYRPDVILAHPGWGETLFIKDVFPNIPLIHFCEYYYHAKGADSGFDPEFPATWDSTARIRAANALHLLNLEQCDVGVTPTHWQRSLHPEVYRPKIQVIHEGVDCENIKPDPVATFELPNGEVLRAGDPIVTYVARNLEPYRGFHSFMRAIPNVLQMHPTAKILIAGRDGVSYGGKPRGYKNWREKMIREIGIDSDRVVFLGGLSTPVYRKLLQVSAAHVYLTYPFVLSWSVLEAMAAGCSIIASCTQPVQEVITDNVNGRLVNFFDGEGIAHRVVEAISECGSYDKVRSEARLASLKYSASAGVDKYLALIGSF